jgi:hypothetical protein
MARLLQNALFAGTHHSPEPEPRAGTRSGDKMATEMQSTQEIRRSIDGTRNRIDADLEELSTRIRERSRAVPGWLKGAGVAAVLLLARRPLFRVVKSAAAISFPIVVRMAVPVVIGRLLERRQDAYEDDPLFTASPTESPGA